MRSQEKRTVEGGIMNERPAESRKTAGTTELVIKTRLTVLSSRFLAIKRWFLLAYHHIRVRKAPAAACTSAYTITVNWMLP